MKEAFELEINGIKGVIKLTELGFEAKGKWASMTGYKAEQDAKFNRFQGVFSDAALVKIAIDKATALFNRQCPLPFLVGDEYKELGWKLLSISPDGRVRIRLPGWHEGEVARTLESLDINEECKLNNYWVFPRDVSMSEARDLLSPIIKESTRFVSESVLAKRLEEQSKTCGYAMRECQLDLLA